MLDIHNFVNHSEKLPECISPVRVRLRVCRLPHPEHSENLDQELKVQSSLQGTQQLLKRDGIGPAHRRHSDTAAISSYSSTQLTPERAHNQTQL